MLLKIDCIEELDGALGTIAWYMERYSEEWTMEDLNEPLGNVVKYVNDPNAFTIYGETSLTGTIPLSADDQEFLNELLWDLVAKLQKIIISHLGAVQTFGSSFELVFNSRGKLLLKVS